MNTSKLKPGDKVSAFLCKNGEVLEEDDTKLCEFILEEGDKHERHEVNGLIYIEHAGEEYQLYAKL